MKNVSFDELREQYNNDPFVEILMRNAAQRAALMALLTKFLREEDETLNIRNVKIAICNFFSHMIDERNMVNDDVDKAVMEDVITFCTQEQLLESFKN